MDLFNILLEKITEYAYLAIVLLLSSTGLGVPVPEDLVVIAAGVLSQREQIAAPIGAWLSAFAGVVISDCALFFIGEHFGKAVLHRRSIKRLLHPRRVLRAHRQVHEHGAWMIFAARFIPGSRTATLLISGMMHLSRWKAFFADTTGAAMSVSVQFGLGWWFASNWSLLMEHRPVVLAAGAGLGLLVLGVYAVWRWRCPATRGRGVSLREFKKRHRWGRPVEPSG